MKYAPGIFLIVSLFCAPATAGVIDDSMDTAGEWWDHTREYAGSAMDQARRLWRDEQQEHARLWESLMPRLDRLVTLQDRHRELPESAWFGEDRETNQAEMDRLLDDAALILTGDNRFRSEAQAVSRAMEDNRRAIAELQRRKMTAPSDSVWRKTVNDLDEEIRARRRVMDEQQQELLSIRREFARELQGLGLDIDAGRLDFLLATVVGDEVVDMTVAFEQVRGLTEQLETLTENSHEDLEEARRYYGMYTVLLRVLDRMHINLMEGIDQRYLPEIGVIENRAAQLRQETRALLASEPSPVLRANLEAQQLTIDAAQRYGDYLKRQRGRVAASRERLGRDLAVADNTYETVKVSGDLVVLMKDGRRLLDTLFSLQVPRLRAFENLEMKREFERLTMALKQG